MQNSVENNKAKIDKNLSNLLAKKELRKLQETERSFTAVVATKD